MALSNLFPVGQRVKVVRGSYKNKQGKVERVGGSKVVILDDNTVLYGASDEMVKRA
ncbi:hypothetical protein SEA_YABOI_114 [Streptomyces phage Yaboi]|uniref:KOW domain-containing protein n=2 Tax=Streptomyces virus Yaboi TaxID=2846408 RepID=A0A385UIF4_9CAUD|nr:KOW motif-containing protein [Streptomyces phage Yaboi]AYB70945.1 hypothetical protein SEA_YABOI_114 [Streptomyces phage Yaboi]QAY12759.1 hypothetical protein SEA_BOOMERJR_114 [Streptomyces phage BoomerJR]UVD39954.1 hypothetical protein SEA_STANIMAL_113 [Streptomyces phage Stanimal]WNM73695.1 hypothetical protein SEA_SOLLERTIA_113 [Streptomyces phage Sollertia]